MYNSIIDFIKSLYPDQNPVPLHAPVFLGKEKEYLIDCIDSTYVSYVGKYVTKFEQLTAEYTGSKYAIAVVNGTAALQIALLISGVTAENEVITQPLTFVATANAISHCGAKPIFVDVDLETMGLSPEKLESFLRVNTEIKRGLCINKKTGRKIKAVVPMHTFGHPCRIDEIVEIATRYGINVIEDSAESLGSFYKGQHSGTFGLAGILSYNGNKTITTGGGGMILTNNEEFAQKARHITTTGKIPHSWEYIHDRVAFNYRLTNVNAAIGVAQMERLDCYLSNKRATADQYKAFLSKTSVDFFSETPDSKSNFWLNAILFNDKFARDEFLLRSNNDKVMTRPVWRLMNKLEIYNHCQTGDLSNSEWLADRVVNIPSGYRGN